MNEIRGILQEDALFRLPRYKPCDLKKLSTSTQFSKEELKLMYSGFKQQCPNGVCTEENFKTLFCANFPLGDANHYAVYVFNACKKYTKRSTINFEQFLHFITLLTRGTFEEKVKWIFTLYDINEDGFVTRDEMQTIVNSIYELLGNYTMPAVDIDTPNEHVDNIFSKMDLNNDGIVSFQDFLEWCKKDESRVKNLFVFDTILV